MIGPSSGSEKSSGRALTLKPLQVPDASKIDGLRLVETARGPALLVSTQSCRSPRRGFRDCQMEIKAVSPRAPEQVTPVAVLPRLLPPPPRWDACAEDGGYRILYEEAGGALYKLLLRDHSGATTSPSAAHPLQSFTQPRFVRTLSESAGRAMIAALDDKALVLFQGGAGSPTSAAAIPYTLLADAPDGVVGQTAEGLWMVTKTRQGGAAAFNELPGQLLLRRLGRADAAAGTPTTPFPEFLAYELDALSLSGDVVVFATGKPSVLLLGSRPSQPIQLAASQNDWLSRLSRPTLSSSGGNLHIAAIANPGTDDARVLYGDFPVTALRQP